MNEQKLEFIKSFLKKSSLSFTEGEFICKLPKHYCKDCSLLLQFTDTYKECIWFIYNVLLEHAKDDIEITMKTTDEDFTINADIITSTVTTLWPERLI